MREPQVERSAAAPSATVATGNGRGSGLSDPLDRSYLLRRASRFPFPQLLEETEAVRLRRERRVCAPFTAILPLSRNGRG